MNRIKCKLRSTKGASITFALLLFLVCAILSSVILVAGTTAAGRLSEMATTEQSYYSVTSAAKLIQETMEKGSSTLIRIEEGSSDDDEGIYKANGMVGDLQKISPGSGTGATTLDSLPDFVAYKVCSKSDAVDNLNLGVNGENTGLTSALSGMTIQESNDTADEGNCVRFTIKKDKYRVVLEFSTHMNKSQVQIGDVVSPENEKIVCTWELSDIRVY